MSKIELSEFTGDSVTVFPPNPSKDGTILVMVSESGRNVVVTMTPSEVIEVATAMLKAADIIIKRGAEWTSRS